MEVISLFWPSLIPYKCTFYPLKQCFIISEFRGMHDDFSLRVLYPQQAAVSVNSSGIHFEGLIKADEEA